MFTSMRKNRNAGTALELAFARHVTDREVTAAANQKSWTWN
jgi:hypothetical protein